MPLPLLTNPEKPTIRYVQEVDQKTNLLACFKKLDGDRQSEIPIIDGPIARIGFSQIYCFCDQAGAVHSGTLDDLEQTLRSFMAGHQDQYGLALQIADLIGTPDEKRAARQSMRQVIDRRSGPQASVFFQGSALRSTLWDRLVCEAKDADAADQILRSRLQIEVAVLSSGIELKSIFVNFDSLLRTNASIILQDIAADFLIREISDATPTKSLDDSNSVLHNDWGIEWLDHWRAAKGRDEILTLTEEGMRWLSEAPVEARGWFQVWHVLWSLPDINRRKRLTSLALTWLKVADLGRPSWLILWETLWTDCKIDFPERSSTLVMLGLAWLGRATNRNSYWASHWRKLWSIAQLSANDERTVASLALEWLKESATHPGWASVWRSLWKTYRGSQSGIELELLEISSSWICENFHHPGWASIWLRLWEWREKPNSVDELFSLAVNWLEQIDPATTNSWPPIWKTMWTELPDRRSQLESIRAQWQQPKQDVELQV